MKTEATSGRPESLSVLLSHLDVNPELAGERYESLRRALMRYFEMRAVTMPEELADAALDRVGRKIAEGEAVREPEAFCLGVARFVYLEWQRNPARRQVGLEDWEKQASSLPEDAADADSRQTCMKQCLQRLPADKRELVRDYFLGAGRERIRRRETIAARLGVNQAALQNRIKRLLDKLRECKVDCLRTAAAR